VSEGAARRWVGERVARLEDAALLTGRARFIDDLSPVPGIRHAAILRSPYAHAEIGAVDASRAEALSGVVGVLTPSDVALLSKPIANLVADKVRYYPCAVGRARYFGEPVAVVVAEDRYLAEDALDLIRVEYRPLPAAVEPEAAMAGGAPVLHEAHGSNVVHRRSFRYGDPERAFAEAAHHVAVSVCYPRVASTPIETYGAIACYEGAPDRFTIWSNFQGPFALHPLMAEALGVPSQRLRLVTPPASGGSFGIKQGIFPYLVLLALASRKLGVPVKWIEDRIEHLAASSAASGRVTRIAGAFDAEGVLRGLRIAQIENLGAYIRAPEPAGLYRMHATASGPYRVRDIAIDNIAVVTNQLPSGLNRGYGGPQFFFPLERLMHEAALRLGIDQAEIRRRNFVPAAAMPYEGPGGSVLDSGDYRAALDLALGTADYPALKAWAAAARAEGRLAGVGLAAAVETSASNMAYVGTALTPEERARALPKSGAGAAATVAMDPLGGVVVRLDSTPAGQGHRTVAAQIVADELGLAPEEIRVETELDTLATPWSITSGNYANRFSTAVASAVALAARAAAAKLKRVAAAQLGVGPEEVVLADGRASAAGGRNIALPIRRLAAQLHWHSSGYPEGVAGPVYETANFAPAVLKAAAADDRLRSSLTYGFQIDVAAVEIDRDTGALTIARYATAHDAGTLLNPALAEGQIAGGFAHGLGAALMERVAYAADGTLLSATFQDYLCPTACEVPDIAIAHLASPSPNTPLGAKGLGDGSSMAAPAALANAIADATGLADLAPPFTPPRLWALLHPGASEEVAAPAERAAPAESGGLAGEAAVTLAAAPEAVFAALLSPAVLQRAVPGCEAVEETAPGRFRARIRISVAGIGGAYEAEIAILDQEPPRRLTLAGSAAGRLGGGSGEAVVTIAPTEGGGARLAYRYRGRVTGPIAGFGHRLLDGVLRLLVADFFAGLEAALAPDGRRQSLRARLARRLALWRAVLFRR
jgi:2-furoyl-CoA dehydrogenase large subunit